MMSRNMASAQKMSQQYGQVKVESEIASADPHRLVGMLLDGARVRIAKAKVEIDQGQFEEKIAHLTQAVAIVDSLRASLNFELGGEIVKNLEGLYDYMTTQLVLANSRNDVEMLDEVAQLLKDVSDAWGGIRSEAVPSGKQASVESEVSEKPSKAAFSASV